MEVVSLFSGCGGTDLGFSEAGHDVIWANDIDRWACESYGNNLGFKSVCDNISKVKQFPAADVLLGCYPCQGFSVYGSRRMNDPRNSLYLQFSRALAKVRPKFFVTENVKGLLYGYGASILNKMLSNFKRRGYRTYWRLLNAKDYGVPQNRERVFIVGVRQDLSFEYIFPEKTHGLGLKPFVTLKEAIGDLPAPRESEYHRGGFSSHYMSRNRKRGWNEISFTIQASGRHAPLHPSSETPIKICKDKYIFPLGSKYRRLSVRECARLQSFPDSFVFFGPLSSQYRQIGNAVPPHLALKIAESF